MACPPPQKKRKKESIASIREALPVSLPSYNPSQVTVAWLLLFFIFLPLMKASLISIVLLLSVLNLKILNPTAFYSFIIFWSPLFVKFIQVVVYSWLVHFHYCTVVVHYMNIPQSVCLFSCWWICGLIIIFGYWAHSMSVCVCECWRHHVSATSCAAVSPYQSTRDRRGRKE